MTQSTIDEMREKYDQILYSKLFEIYNGAIIVFKEIPNQFSYKDDKGREIYYKDCKYERFSIYDEYGFEIYYRDTRGKEELWERDHNGRYMPVYDDATLIFSIPPRRRFSILECEEPGSPIFARKQFHDTVNLLIDILYKNKEN